MKRILQILLSDHLSSKGLPPSEFEQGFLDQLRIQLLLLTMYIGLGICLVLAVIRIMEGNSFMTLLAIFGFFLIGGFVFLCKKGYHEIITAIASMTFLFLVFLEGYRLNMPYQTICYFAVIPSIFCLVTKSKPLRITILVVFSIAFLVLSLLTQAESIGNILIYCVVMGLYLFVFLTFIHLVEAQELNIQTAIQQKNQALSELEETHQEMLVFNNMMNHDIKAPLRTIKGFTALLQREDTSSEKQEEYLRFLASSADTLDRLVSDLSVLSTAGSGTQTFDPISLNAVIDEVLKDLSFDIQHRDVNLDVDNMPEIYANREGLKRVFRNLLSNSIKYQPDDPIHIPHIKIWSQHSEHTVDMFVQDNGIGIEEPYREKIFIPFVRSSQSTVFEGTGLGMAICKTIIENHGGTIEYYPQDLPGTCFRVSMPISSSVSA